MLFTNFITVYVIYNIWSSKLPENNLGIFARFRRYFLAGILVISPILITVYVTWIIITFIGALTPGFLGRTILKSGERVLDKMPVVRSVYGAIKQVMETVMSTNSNSFREVVLVEYPRKGIWVIGFVTGETKGEVQSLKKEKLINVFIPTTPNPTSGFLLFFPKKDLIYMHMKIEDAVKMVISGGIVTPKIKK